MIEESQSLQVEDGRPYTYTLLRRRSSIQSFNDDEIPRKVSPSWPKMLLLVAKVRTYTTNFGTENETPSIRQSCSEEIKLLSGKCHTQALGCSLINTHLQQTRSQQKVPVI